MDKPRNLNAPWVGFFMKWMARANTWIYKRSNGKRGGTFLHVLNGQLMAVMIDDDPASSNNASGQFGIEIEATTKVWVRNIWVKKLS